MPATPHDASAAWPATTVSSDAARAAIAGLLQPLLRLALQAGLKYADLDALLREGLLRLAPKVVDAENVSQVSVLTGLNRKAVAQWRKAPAEPGAVRSLAGQVFTLWRHVREQEPQLRRLPLNQPLQRVRGRGRKLPQSFAALARQVSRDVHPRSMLDELLRLGLAEQRQGEVELVEDAFVPKADADARLALMAANAASHVAAGVDNCAAGVRPWLEQSIWADGVSRADCVLLDERARALWQEAHRQLFDAIAAMPEAAEGEPRHRVRVGIYVHAEPLEEAPCNDESPAA